MEIASNIISVPTLLFFVAGDLAPATTIGTGVCMLITFAFLCYAFARANGLPALSWFSAGLLLGAFALAAVFVRIERSKPPTEPRSDKPT